MSDFVIGFLFDDGRTRVTLIRKNKPEWQKGLLNGVGGKIEEGEEPVVAMAREFLEETGVEVATGWECFAQLVVPKGGEHAQVVERVAVWCYRAFDSRALKLVRSATDEVVMLVAPTEVQHAGNVVANLRWLIPLALDTDGTNGMGGPNMVIAHYD